ncbi:MAG: hypothetical protein U0793_22445 [Gemmataceae bacterium]
MARFRLPATILFGLLFLGIVGCGGRRYQPTGKLTKGGAPLKLSEKAVLQLAFFAESDTKLSDAFPTSWEKDGSFKILGRDGGIPAGKYHTSIVIIDPYPGGKDLLGGRMANGKGPVVEIKGDEALNIDLDAK